MSTTFWTSTNSLGSSVIPKTSWRRRILTSKRRQTSTKRSTLTLAKLPSFGRSRMSTKISILVLALILVLVQLNFSDLYFHVLSLHLSIIVCCKVTDVYSSIYVCGEVVVTFKVAGVKVYLRQTCNFRSHAVSACISLWCHRPMHACCRPMHACIACIAPWHHRPMHSLTAWAMLLWFCLEYTFTSS